MGKKLVDHPHQLPDIDERGFTPLRQWRESHKLSPGAAADRLGISKATYYRYESNGMIPNISKANHIVELTNGEVRYRDLIGGFKPEYA